MIAERAPEARKSKLLRALSVSLLYGYHDHALALARGSSDVLSAKEIALIEARITAAGCPGSGIPQFPGRRQLAAIFKRLWETCLSRRGLVDQRFRGGEPAVGSLEAGSLGSMSSDSSGSGAATISPAISTWL